MIEHKIEPQRNRASRHNFFIGGFILAGITLVVGLLWGIVSNYSMIGMMAYALFGVFTGEPLSTLSALLVYLVIFLYGSLINFVTFKGSISNNKLMRAILYLLTILLIIFYLFAMILAFLGNG